MLKVTESLGSNTLSVLFICDFGKHTKLELWDLPDSIAVKDIELMLRQAGGNWRHPDKVLQQGELSGQIWNCDNAEVLVLTQTKITHINNWTIIRIWTKTLGHLQITPTGAARHKAPGVQFSADVNARKGLGCSALVTFMQYIAQRCNFRWSSTLSLNHCGF